VSRPAALAGPDRPMMGDPSGDLIDLADAGRILRRRWGAVMLITLLGALAAVAVLLWAPRRFDGAASIVVRSAADPSSSLLGRLGLPSELAPSALAGAIKSPLETELQILESRAVLGPVIDSLGLQVRVLAPRGHAPWQLLRPTVYPGAFKKRTLRFERVADGYEVTGPGVRGRVAPGRPLVTPVGTLRLADGPLPASFTVQLLDHEDALRRLGEHAAIAKAGGEVVRVGYGAPDSLSAAAVPNAIVKTYLARRVTTDRSVNQYRAEFLTVQLDSVNRQLAESERALRAFQEGQGGVIDPELVGKIELEAASKVREAYATNRVESVALDSLLRQVQEGRATARELAGYPSLLRSPAINEIVGELAKHEAERTRLLERRTEADPAIVALNEAIAGLERQIVPLGRAYAASLSRQRGELQTQVAAFDAEVARLPASAQSFVRLQREVKRLGQTSLVLQSQLLDARLAAVGEGGETRQLDVATPPKRVGFPRPSLTLAAGVGGGMVGGVLFVLLVGFLSPRVSGPGDVTRVTGLPAAELGRGSAVFHALVRPDAGLTVVPMNARADAEAVARWLAINPVRAGVPAPYSLAGRALAPVGEGRMQVVTGEPNGDLLHPTTEVLVPSVLPPLASPEGAAAIARAERVILAVPAGAHRRELADVVDAVRLRGVEPVAVVLT
jgi:uncharacterized protein involved in exopolysaccharide biosynthesis